MILYLAHLLKFKTVYCLKSNFIRLNNYLGFLLVFESQMKINRYISKYFAMQMG